MKHLFILFILCLFCLEINAQDRHFTQFYASPIILNPALTGNYDGKYRASIIYRNQWSSIIDNPFTSYSMAFDVRFNTVEKKGQDALGMGLMFFSDKMGTSDFSTNQMNITAAYHKSLTIYSKKYLSAGFQMGIAQRSVDYDDFTFQDQFDGLSGYNGTTLEELPRNNHTFADLGVGIFYTSSPKRGYAFNMGLGVNHVNFPDVSFDETTVDRLHAKFSTQIGGEAKMSNKVSILPRFVASLQGPHMEANIGTNFKFLLSDYDGMFLYVGSWVRPVLDAESTMSLDAAVFLTAIEYQNFRLGLSYDINLSRLISVTSGRGAFEISFAFVGNYGNDNVVCPTF